MSVPITNTTDEKFAIYPNQLISTRYPRLTKLENQLFWRLMYETGDSVEDADLSEVYEIRPQDIFPYQIGACQYSALLEITSGLQDRKIEIKTVGDARFSAYNLTGEDMVVRAPLVQTCYFFPEKKRILVSLHPEIIKLVKSQRRENYTKIYEQIMLLGSIYSQRLYALLFQYRNIGKRSFALEELKALLDVTETYAKYTHFKAVIVRCQKEMEGKTDIKFTFEEIKTGRKVSDLVFTIRANRKTVGIQQKPVLDDSDISDAKTKDAQTIVSILRRYEIKENIGLKYAREYGFNVGFFRYVDKCMKESRNILTPAGYLISHLPEWDEAYRISLLVNEAPVSVAEDKKTVEEQTRKEKNDQAEADIIRWQNCPDEVKSRYLGKFKLLPEEFREGSAVAKWAVEGYPTE